MTAKSRRHKLDKKRKSDEHPHPRRAEEDRGRSEGTRSRTGLIPRKREGKDAPDEVRVIEKIRLHSVSLVGEDAYALGFIEIKEEDLEREGVTPLHEVDLEADGIGNFYGKKLYLNDAEKELYDRVLTDRKEARLRASGASDAATSSESSGTSGDA